MIMSQRVNLKNGWPTILIPNKQLYVIRDDWEVGIQRADSRPYVRRFQPHHYSWMTEDIQEFWFGLNRNPANKAVQAWNSYTNSGAFITNDKGTDRFRNYIDNTNMDKGLPGIQTLGCARNVLAGVEIEDDEGIMQLEYEYIDSTDPIPAGISYETHPWLIHIANIITTIRLPNGTYKVNAFDHLGGREGFPVKFPIMARGLTKMRFPLSQLRKLTIGAPLPPVYNPP